MVFAPLTLRRLRLLLAGAACLPAIAHATGGYDDEPPPSLPYYMDRLPAKPPAEIFEETFTGSVAAAKSVDFKGALLALAKDCEAGQPPPVLLATTDGLLAQARLHPWQAAALCNVLNDVRDLFAAVTSVTGKPAAGYIRWRVEHAPWFNLTWDQKAPQNSYAEDELADRAKREREQTLAKFAASADAGPLRVHWMYLRAALDYPTSDGGHFQEVADAFPDHPRTEAARFMLARCKLVASRAYRTPYEEPTAENLAAAAKDRAAARALFEDYLKRYPKGRFVADVPGWLGALAFADRDYLGALDQYLQQADVPGHPEVLKSAGFMCERCLSELADKGDEEALKRVAAHPRLAMSLIYLLVNADDSPDSADSKEEPRARVDRWRRALLPRLAAQVVANKEIYAGTDWQPRYLAILAQAASGVGDQDKALQLCEVGKDQLTHSDDLAFIRLVALARGHRLPEAIAAGREFARLFPKSVLLPGALLRLALALQDDHQAGAAVGELLRLQRTLAPQAEARTKAGEEPIGDSNNIETVYPRADGVLSVSRSVLRSDASGVETAQLAQVIDTLLNFAPLPELAAAVDGQRDLDAANLRAVLVQRWLAEAENFAEAKKYATPAEWSVTAAKIERLTATAAAAPTGEARANACRQVAEGWAAARGKLVFAPLETDTTRHDLFASDQELAGTRRRENGLALGLPPEQVNSALEARDEWVHAGTWWIKAADAAPPESPLRARALWSALRAMPAMVVASPYLFQRAGETDASGRSRQLYERLRRECPNSREAREFAVYYDLAPPVKVTEAQGDAPKTSEPDLAAALAGETLPYGEPEYRWDGQDSSGGFVSNYDGPDREEAKAMDDITKEALGLTAADAVRDPQTLLGQVETLRARMGKLSLQRSDLFLANFLDDLADFLQEPAAKLKPAAVGRYLDLRRECLSVEHWGGSDEMPKVPGAGEDNLDETVLGHIRAAYKAPEMAGLKDYLDFLALAVIANHNVDLEIPGETQDDKQDENGKKVPATYRGRDYVKLARLAEGFLMDSPHSRKREAVRLLYARALYAASRPVPWSKFAVWPESGHFASGTIIASHRQEAFDPKKIGAALNAYDREYPHGRYSADIRNLRGLLAWRTQDWPLALDLTLQTLGDEHDAALQLDATRRLNSIFVDGLTDETERTRCLAAIKANATAVGKLRDCLSKAPYPLAVIRSWVLAQL